MAEIQLERKKEEARLRVYLGAAPGVGKTYHMLNDAYVMKHQQGVDVVIGLVEVHGRKETEARIRDLEIIPQRVIGYRGVNLKEMDVDAILARHPHTVVVDVPYRRDEHDRFHGPDANLHHEGASADT